MIKEASEHIMLPDMVIAGLYRQALVVPDAPEEGGVAATSLPSAALPAVGEQAWRPETGGTASAHEVEAREAAAAPASTNLSPVGEAETSAQAYRFLGNNSKKVVVIVYFPHDAFLPEQHLQFLGRILGACKMNLGDIAIVNHATQPVVIGRLKQQLQPAYVLLFGPAPTDIQLPLSFTPFKEQQYDGCQYLYAPSLNDLNQEGEQARPLKSQLWNCLKKMFHI